jgi:pre-mRNA-splicing factor ISY1
LILTPWYRYFGRAKELPGVKELFQSRKVEEEEQNATFNHYKRFMDQGEDYYGTPVDGDDDLDKLEREEEENG